MNGNISSMLEKLPSLAGFSTSVREFLSSSLIFSSSFFFFFSPSAFPHHGSCNLFAPLRKPILVLQPRTTSHLRCEKNLVTHIILRRPDVRTRPRPLHLLHKTVEHPDEGYYFRRPLLDPLFHLLVVQRRGVRY